MVFIAAGEKLNVFQCPDFSRCIAPQTTSDADQAGTFMSVNDVLDLDAPARQQRLVSPMLRAPRPTRHAPASSSLQKADAAPPAACCSVAPAHSPVAIAQDMLAFSTLREQMHAPLVQFQHLLLADEPAADAVVSTAQVHATRMAASLLAGAGPLEIEWMYRMPPGAVVGFIYWLKAVPVLSAIQIMRTSTIRATLEPMFGAMHKAGMMHDARPGLGYALCRNLAAVFGSQPTKPDNSQTALQSRGVVSFAHALYQQGPTWGLEMLRSLVAQDEAEAGADIIERNGAVAARLVGSSKKIVRAICQAKKPGYVLDRALAEEGLNADQIVHCKDYLIHYKAEVLLENMFASAPVEISSTGIRP